MTRSFFLRKYNLPYPNKIMTFYRHNMCDLFNKNISKLITEKPSFQNSIIF